MTSPAKAGTASYERPAWAYDRLKWIKSLEAEGRSHRNPRDRVRTKQMKVLVIGMMRTGTVCECGGPLFSRANSCRRIPCVDIARLCTRYVCKGYSCLAVLLIGAPRAALKTALHHLGYDGIYHMESIVENPDDAYMWAEAMRYKGTGKGRPFTKEDFDQVLGESEVRSPCCYRRSKLPCGCSSY